MCTFSIRLTEAEKKLIKEYSKLNNKSMSEVLKAAFFEKMEDEFDIKMADEAYKEYKKDSKKYTLNEARKELGL